MFRVKRRRVRTKLKILAKHGIRDIITVDMNFMDSDSGLQKLCLLSIKFTFLNDVFRI